MNRQDAEKIITEYLKPIFGFALKRCKNAQDAEDLSQDIVLKAFRALLIKDNILDANKFIWTIAHNSLSNYYRDTAKSIIGVSIDDIAQVVGEPDPMLDDNAESLRRLQSEIAYLSKLQRKIVIAYYFENRKQSDIARDLNIPLGTVKWHLFEAKKELKRGMDTMRKESELKFNPIKFHSYGINGLVGTKSLDEFLRSTLSQNICYCVRKEAKTVNEIAEALGVSPVYVETEVDFLEEYGFLEKQNNKYIANFIIIEPTAEHLTMENSMYKKVAGLFANELYDELVSSEFLEHPDILCELMDFSHADTNFILWSLIPYITANLDEKIIKAISFEEVATVRPDGGHNICQAAVISDNMALPDDYVYMKKWCGPMVNDNGEYVCWQINSEWSDRGDLNLLKYSDNSNRVLSLFKSHCCGKTISDNEYAWLAEQGFVKILDERENAGKVLWQVVIISNNDIREKLLSIGEKVMTKYKEEFDVMRAPYVDAVLNSVPAHLRNVKEYELQYMFADGRFLKHCIVTLLNNGKLKPPTEGQKKALSTLIVKR